jgi:hypothetical protein
MGVAARTDGVLAADLAISSMYVDLAAALIADDLASAVNSRGLGWGMGADTLPYLPMGVDDIPATPICVRHDVTLSLTIIAPAGLGVETYMSI